MAVLVTGGAGYIGSHVVRKLNKNNRDVIVLDDLSTGHQEAIKGNKLIVGDIADSQLVEKVIKENNIDSVIHFAASSLVGESMENPSKYYYNNVVKTLKLLDAMINNDVKKIVFSSTAAVYGNPTELPVKEDGRLEPTNVYGKTKMMIEEIIKDYHRAYGLDYVILRYFNAAGADDSGDIGEDHSPETHLIPLILQVPLGKREKISIYGDDYDTQDGSCVRDYIHVGDLARAHVMSLDYLCKELGCKIYNLGNGKGFSVKEVIEATEKIIGKPIKQEIVGRRQGDPHSLIASSYNIQQELGWEPEYITVESIIRTAWNWHFAHPDGYDD